MQSAFIGRVFRFDRYGATRRRRMQLCHLPYIQKRLCSNDNNNKSDDTATPTSSTPTTHTHEPPNNGSTSNVNKKHLSPSELRKKFCPHGRRKHRCPICCYQQLKQRAAPENTQHQQQQQQQQPQHQPYTEDNPLIIPHSLEEHDTTAQQERVDAKLDIIRRRISEEVAHRLAAAKVLLKPYTLCVHQLFKHQCLICTPRYNVRNKSANFRCEHGKKWKICHLGPSCGGNILCEDHHDMCKAIWIAEQVADNRDLSWAEAVQQYPGTPRWRCRFCRGFAPCPHGVRKQDCAQCPDGGQSLCAHGRSKFSCIVCDPTKSSRHQDYKKAEYTTLEKINDMIVANGGVPLSRHEVNLTYCEHGNKRGFCPAPPPHGCGNTYNYCEHGAVYWLCVTCNPRLANIPKMPTGRTTMVTIDDITAPPGSAIDSLIKKKIEEQMKILRK